MEEKKNRVSETTTSLKDFCDFKDHWHRSSNYLHYDIISHFDTMKDFHTWNTVVPTDERHVTNHWFSGNWQMGPTVGIFLLQLWLENWLKVNQT